MSRVTQETGVVWNKDAIRVTTSPRECWFEVSDPEAFKAWISDQSDTGAGYSFGEANRAWMHDKLDAWMETVIAKCAT